MTGGVHVLALNWGPEEAGALAVLARLPRGHAAAGILLPYTLPYPYMPCVF